LLGPGDDEEVRDNMTTVPNAVIAPCAARRTAS